MYKSRTLACSTSWRETFILRRGLCDLRRMIKYKIPCFQNAGAPAWGRAGNGETRRTGRQPDRFPALEWRKSRKKPSWFLAK